MKQAGGRSVLWLIVLAAMAAAQTDADTGTLDPSLPEDLPGS